MSASDCRVVTSPAHSDQHCRSVPASTTRRCCSREGRSGVVRRPGAVRPGGSGQPCCTTPKCRLHPARGARTVGRQWQGEQMPLLQCSIRTSAHEGHHRLALAQGSWNCALCGSPTIPNCDPAWRANTPECATTDHVEPGAGDHAFNLRLMHKACNSQKHRGGREYMREPLLRTYFVRGDQPNEMLWRIPRKSDVDHRISRCGFAILSYLLAQPCNLRGRRLDHYSTDLAADIPHFGAGLRELVKRGALCSRDGFTRVVLPARLLEVMSQGVV